MAFRCPEEALQSGYAAGGSAYLSAESTTRCNRSLMSERCIEYSDRTISGGILRISLCSCFTTGRGLRLKKRSPRNTLTK